MSTVHEAPRKKPRVVFDLVVAWDRHARATPLEVIGDNALIVGWLNGEMRCEDKAHLSDVAGITEKLYAAWTSDLLAPRQSHQSRCRHVHRGLNKDADAMATEAITNGTMINSWATSLPYGKVTRLRAYFDGGRRDGVAGCGWVLFATFSSSVTDEDDHDCNWVRVGSGAIQLGDSTPVHAELKGASDAVDAAIQFASHLVYST